MYFSLSQRRSHSAATDLTHARPRRRSKALLGAAFAVLILATPSMASAEDGWSSYLANVRSPWMSRIWTDHDRDNNATTLQISGCSRTDGARFLLKAELRRSVWGPDVSLGTRDVSGCVVGTVSVNWGDPGPGDYYLVFTHYDFGHVSARSIYVSY